MSVIFLLITASTLVAGVFLVAFIMAVRNGQFDDDKSPAVRILNDPQPPSNETILTPSPSFDSSVAMRPAVHSSGVAQDEERGYFPRTKPSNR